MNERCSAQHGTTVLQHVEQTQGVDPSGRAAKTWVCSRSIAGMAVSNSDEDMDVSLVIVVCCQVSESG